MKPEDQQLMHEVLDGEASAEDVHVLEGVLATDPAARTEYEQLQRLFKGLNAPRKAAIPEELIAGVLSRMPQHARSRRINQLSSRWRVFVSDSTRSRDFQVEHNTRNAFMSEKTSNRTLWIGGGVAAVVLIIVSRFFNVPSTQDISGTIAPAHRSVAEQPGAADVSGPAAGQAGSPSAQAGASADAAIDAAKSDSAKADAGRLDAAKSDAMKSDAAKLDAAKADAMKSDAAKFNAAKADAMKADAAHFDAAKADAMKADAAKFDAAKADAMKADAAKFNAAKADAAKFDAAKVDAAKANAAKADSARSNN